MPGILGRNGVSRIPEPAVTQEELQASQRNADTLKAASRRIGARRIEERPGHLDVAGQSASRRSTTKRLNTSIRAWSHSRTSYRTPRLNRRIIYCMSASERRRGSAMLLTVEAYSMFAC